METHNRPQMDRGSFRNICSLTLGLVTETSALSPTQHFVMSTRLPVIAIFPSSRAKACPERSRMGREISFRAGVLMIEISRQARNDWKGSADRNGDHRPQQPLCDVTTKAASTGGTHRQYPKITIKMHLRTRTTFERQMPTLSTCRNVAYHLPPTAVRPPSEHGTDESRRQPRHSGRFAPALFHM